MKYIVVFSFLLLGFVRSYAQKSPDGTWHSAFVVMGQSMLMDLEIKFQTNEVSIYMPDQTMMKLVCSDVILDDNLVHFAWKQGNLEYQGFYFPDGDSINGTMKQNGLEWLVTFHREVQQKIELSRPQTPKPPFNYKTEEVSFQNKYDKTTIYGTLTFPKNGTTGNFPVVVLASGSGPQDRNETILGHEPFFVIADYLAEHGIATLRFDDRGTGMSKANFKEGTVEKFGQDVASCVSYLKKRKDLKKHPVGLIGHSEGGLHIMVAQELLGKKVNFMVFLACIGENPAQTLIRQQYEIPKKNGSPEVVAVWNRDVFQGISDLIQKFPDTKQCSDSLNPFLSKMYHSAPKGAIDGQTESNFVVNMTLFMNNAWGRSFLDFDPAAHLKQLSNTPVLALFGSEDLQVDPKANLTAFESNLSEDEKKISTLEIIPGINHLLQKCDTCTVMEYGELTETINPVVLEKLTQFILNL